MNAIWSTILFGEFIASVVSKYKKLAYSARNKTVHIPKAALATEYLFATVALRIKYTAENIARGTRMAVK